MALTTIPAAGAKLRASVLSSLITEVRPIVANKTADETVNNSATLQNDDELFVAVEANCTYHFAARIRYSTGVTPDLKFAWTFPTGLTMLYNVTVVAVATSVLLDFDFTQTDTATVEGAAVVKSAMCEGRVTTGANAGTLQLQWAQSTANASNSIVKAASFIELRRWS